MIDAADYRARQTEAEFQSAIVDAARALGWLCVHFPRMQGNPSGWPDWIMLRDGRWLVVELKREDGKLSRHQRDWLERLAAHGAETYVWRPSMWDEALAVLEETA